MQQQEQLPEAPSKKGISQFFRVLKYFIYTLLFLIVFIAGGSVALTFYYQNEVKGYIVDELNKQLNTQIIIDGKDIDFTILKNFPLASLEFKNVKALDAIPSSKNDTLFKAETISLQFNISDIFNKNYQIKKIQFKNAELNIRIDKQGNDNYHFWKSSADATSENFSFALNKITLENIVLHYNNQMLQQQADVVVKKSELSGKFSNESYSMDIDCSLFVNELKNNKLYFIRNKNIESSILFDVDNRSDTYSIKKGSLSIEGLACDISGEINAGKNSTVDLSLQGKKMDIQSVLSLIPQEYKEDINNYNSEGKFYINAHIRGSFEKNKMPSINADFGINNATITKVSDDVSLKNVNLKGVFNSGKQLDPAEFLLHISSFQALLQNGILTGDLIIKDFKNPFIDSKIKLDVELQELQKLVKQDTIENISGLLKTDMVLLGKWEDIKNISNSKYIIDGSLNLSDVFLKIKNRTMPFEKVNGSFNFNNNNIVVKSISGIMANSDFYMHGNFNNVVNFLLNNNEKITVEAVLKSQKINLDELLENKNENNADKGEYNLAFSGNVDVKLNSTVEQLVFRKFEASAIKGTLVIKNKKMMIDSVAFKTMDGDVSMSGVVDGSDSSKLFVNSFSTLKNINITKMFFSCENFGQQYITEKNIKGISTASIQFKTFISSQLNVDLEKLYALIDMTIEKGELINVEGLKSLSRFVELQDLMDVRFSKLKNQFEIKNKTISFPKMEIKSNALNVLASGTHTFDNRINYKIKLSMDELLAKKAKKNKKENDEFGEVADDGLSRTNLFLSMTGTVDNPVIKYDTKEAIQSFKQNVKTEKQNVKALLKEELGIFKKDTSINKNKHPEEQPKFKIEWEENKSAPREEKKELKPPKRKREEDDF